MQYRLEQLEIQVVGFHRSYRSGTKLKTYCIILGGCDKCTYR